MRRSPRNSWERAVQVMRWLKAEFALPADLGMELVDDIDGGDTFGQVIMRKGKLIVQLSRRACKTRHDYVLNAIHEAAHVALQQHGVGDYHGPQFWQMYGQMVDAFDHHGHDDSKAYGVD